MSKNIQDRPVNHKDWSRDELAAEAGRVGVAVADGASKREIANALNGDVAASTDAETASTDAETASTEIAVVDAKDLPAGHVLQHTDRGGAVLCAVTKQADGNWLLSTDGKAYSSLSKAAVADHQSRGGKTDSINGRAYFGLPSGVGTPRGASGMPRGKNREALVARRDKLVKMRDELATKIAEAEKAIEMFDIEHANEAEVDAALAELKAQQEAELERKKQEILASIAAKKAATA